MLSVVKVLRRLEIMWVKMFDLIADFKITFVNTHKNFQVNQSDNNHCNLSRKFRVFLR